VTGRPPAAQLSPGWLLAFVVADNEQNADACRANQLLLFVIFFVFLELRLFFAKQSLEHPAPLKIGPDFEHCPIVLNVLLYDKTLHNPLQGRNFLRWPLS
jgi:hypothetical protein